MGKLLRAVSNKFIDYNNTFHCSELELNAIIEVIIFIFGVSGRGL